MDNQIFFSMLKQRDAMVVAQLIEGLQFLIQDARGGDPDAKRTLQALTETLREAQDEASPLSVIRS